jgi:hypothetical protein
MSYFLTDEDKKNIRRMFFGPYKKEWRDVTGQVDNRDDVIAKRLGLPYDNVKRYTIKIDKLHYQEIIAYHNIKPEIFSSRLNKVKHGFFIESLDDIDNYVIP